MTASLRTHRPGRLPAPVAAYARESLAGNAATS